MLQALKFSNSLTFPGLPGSPGCVATLKGVASALYAIKREILARYFWIKYERSVSFWVFDKFYPLYLRFNKWGRKWKSCNAWFILFKTSVMRSFKLSSSSSISHTWHASSIEALWLSKQSNDSAIGLNYINVSLDCL